MTTKEQFESGLRLDQYMAGIAQNKENFRANFIKAVESFSPEDIAFFRALPEKINIAVVTEDDSQDALRDVPVISRMSVEVGKILLRLFRVTEMPELVRLLAVDAGLIGPGAAERRHLPLIVFYHADIRVIGVHTRRVPAIDAELLKRQSDWVALHPEIPDVAREIEDMTPISRTRLNQALYSMTGEQRQHWARVTLEAWRALIGAAFAPAAAAVSPPATGASDGGVSAAPAAVVATSAGPDNDTASAAAQTAKSGPAGRAAVVPVPTVVPTPSQPDNS